MSLSSSSLYWQKPTYRYHAKLCVTVFFFVILAEPYIQVSRQAVCHCLLLRYTCRTLHTGITPSCVSLSSSSLYWQNPTYRYHAKLCVTVFFFVILAEPYIQVSRQAVCHCLLLRYTGRTLHTGITPSCVSLSSSSLYWQNPTYRYHAKLSVTVFFVILAEPYIQVSRQAVCHCLLLRYTGRTLHTGITPSCVSLSSSLYWQNPTYRYHAKLCVTVFFFVILAEPYIQVSRQAVCHCLLLRYTGRTLHTGITPSCVSLSSSSLYWQNPTYRYHAKLCVTVFVVILAEPYIQVSRQAVCHCLLRYTGRTLHTGITPSCVSLSSSSLYWQNPTYRYHAKLCVTVFFVILAEPYIEVSRQAVCHCLLLRYTGRILHTGITPSCVSLSSSLYWQNPTYRYHAKLCVTVFFFVILAEPYIQVSRQAVCHCLLLRYTGRTLHTGITPSCVSRSSSSLYWQNPTYRYHAKLCVTVFFVILAEPYIQVSRQAVCHCLLLRYTGRTLHTGITPSCVSLSSSSLYWQNPTYRYHAKLCVTVFFRYTGRTLHTGITPSCVSLSSSFILAEPYIQVSRQAVCHCLLRYTGRTLHTGITPSCLSLSSSLYWQNPTYRYHAKLCVTVFFVILTERYIQVSRQAVCHCLLRRYTDRTLCIQVSRQAVCHCLLRYTDRTLHTGITPSCVSLSSSSLY